MRILNGGLKVFDGRAPRTDTLESSGSLARRYARSCIANAPTDYIHHVKRADDYAIVQIPRRVQSFAHLSREPGFFYRFGARLQSSRISSGFALSKPPDLNFTL